MSYDIRFGVKVDGTDKIAVIGHPKYDSPTYNLGKMFRACTGWDFEQGTWYHLPEILPKIERGVHELRFNRQDYEQYNPENGWGDLDGALKCLKSIIEWCSDEDERGWNGDVPLEYMYMRW